jgi:hypothetical protein
VIVRIEITHLRSILFSKQKRRNFFAAKLHHWEQTAVSALTVSYLLQSYTSYESQSAKQPRRLSYNRPCPVMTSAPPALTVAVSVTRVPEDTEVTALTSA